jgi:hypothetical protein
MVRSRPGSRNPKEGSLTKSPCPKFKRQVLSCSLPTKSGPRKFLSFIPSWGIKMAAQDGSGYKILRVSMPFERGRISSHDPSAFTGQEGATRLGWLDPIVAVRRVRRWVARLKTGEVQSCAEIARRERITPARVSQLWPLVRMTDQQVEHALSASSLRKVSVRKLLQLAKNQNVRKRVLLGETTVAG